LRSDELHAISFISQQSMGEKRTFLVSENNDDFIAAHGSISPGRV